MKRLQTKYNICSIRSVLLFAALSIILTIYGCTQFLAEKTVMAPNHGKTPEQLGSLSENYLKKWQIDRQLTIKVNSPEAFLHLAIIEPKKEWTITSGTIWYDKLKKHFKEIKKQHPNVNMPETLYWEKFPKDDDGKVGFNFSGRQQEIPPLWQELKGTIICLHGLYVDKTIFNSTWGPILAVHGYRVILVDLRGHGKSTGEYITYGRVESRDISQVIDYMELNDLLNGELIVMGASYGAITALQTAAIDNRIDAVIAMEPCTSLKQAAPEFTKERFGYLAFLLGKKGICKIIDRAGKIADFDPDSNTPLEAVEKISIPILFIHGKNDKHVLLRHSQELHRVASCSKLEIVEGKDHISLINNNIYPLRDKIIAWLDNKNDCKE